MLTQLDVFLDPPKGLLQDTPEDQAEAIRQSLRGFLGRGMYFFTSVKLSLRTLVLARIRHVVRDGARNANSTTAI